MNEYIETLREHFDTPDEAMESFIAFNSMLKGERIARDEAPRPAPRPVNAKLKAAAAEFRRLCAMDAAQAQDRRPTPPSAADVAAFDARFLDASRVQPGEAVQLVGCDGRPQNLAPTRRVAPSMAQQRAFDDRFPELKRVS
jgi:hypothetical protein